MTERIPSRLGPYEVVTRIGSGGAGQVWRARDPRLGRDIAVKVFPSAVNAAADHFALLMQEASAASALNHPNVVTIHDVGLDATPPYIAMELIDGRTLRDEMRAGPMPPERVLGIGAQIAAGLEAAHAAGLVHRDLKPGNVMVTQDSRVKILDFGLAWWDSPRAGEGARKESSSLAAPSPAADAISGTANYMSPEQARGFALDFRSDQFSLGAILYEMLTGRLPFSGETLVDTLTSIVRDDPEPLQTLAPETPPPLTWIVERCLARDPVDRYASTRDLARDLATLRDRWPARGRSSSAWAPACEARRPLRRVVIALAGGLAAAVVFGGGLFAGRSFLRPPSPSFRPLTFEHGTVRGARFLPDGRGAIFGASWEGKPWRLFLRRLEEPEALPIDVPGADRLMAISRNGEMALLLDGRRVAPFVFAGTLARLASSATGPRELQRAVSAADWSPDGRSLATVHEDGGMSILEYPIGSRLHASAGFLAQIRISPDAKRIAFVEHPVRERTSGSVRVIEADGKGLMTLAERVEMGGLAWSPSGREVWYGRQHQLLATMLTGRTRTLLEMPEGVMLHDVSPDGRILLAHDTYRMEIHGRLDSSGKDSDWSWLDWSVPVALSADRSVLVFNEFGEGLPEGGAVCLRRTESASPVRLGPGTALALSPDGHWVLAFEGGERRRLLLLPTGPGPTREIPTGPIRTVSAGAFTPDARKVLLAASGADTPVRLYVVDLAGGEPRLLSRRDVYLGALSVSADGRFVAATGPGRRPWIFPLDGGDPSPVSDLAVGDVVYGFTPDGHGVYYAPFSLVPQPLIRLDLASSERKTLLTLSPHDSSGLSLIGPVCLTPDASGLAYGTLRILSKLFTVSNVK